MTVPGTSIRYDFKTVQDFQRYLKLYSDPTLRRAALVAGRNLPFRTQGITDVATKGRTNETAAKDLMTNMVQLGIARETSPGRYRSAKLIGLTPDLQKQIAALPIGQQEQMLLTGFQTQLDNLNMLVEFFRSGQTAKWLSDFGKARPNLSFGMNNIPASMAGEVQRLMSQFESGLQQALERYHTQLGDKETQEPVMLVQWLLAPIG